MAVQTNSLRWWSPLSCRLRLRLMKTSTWRVRRRRAIAGSRRRAASRRVHRTTTAGPAGLAHGHRRRRPSRRQRRWAERRRTVCQGTSTPTHDNSCSICSRATTARRPAGQRFLASNNVAFPAEPLRGLGGFDEGFGPRRIASSAVAWTGAGYDLGRVPGAVVEHDPQLNLCGLRSQILSSMVRVRRISWLGGEPQPSRERRFHFRAALHIDAGIASARRRARRGDRRVCLPFGRPRTSTGYIVEQVRMREYTFKEASEAQAAGGTCDDTAASRSWWRLGIDAR